MAESARAALLAAGLQIARAGGSSSLSTKAVAAKAGYAESTLFHHFKDKADFLICVLQQALGAPYRDALSAVVIGGDSRTVGENIKIITKESFAFFEPLIAATAAVLAEPRSRSRYAKALRQDGVSPDAGAEIITRYFQIEQLRGRIVSGLDCAPAARLLVSAAFHAAYWAHASGRRHEALDSALGQARFIEYTLCCGEGIGRRNDV